MMNLAIRFHLHLPPLKMVWLDAHLNLSQYLPVLNWLLPWLFLCSSSYIFICIISLQILAVADYFIRTYGCSL